MTRATNPASSGLLVENQEISVRARMRGGPGRTRTSNQAVMSAARYPKAWHLWAFSHALTHFCSRLFMPFFGQSLVSDGSAFPRHYSSLSLKQFIQRDRQIAHALVGCVIDRVGDVMHCSKPSFLVGA